MACLAREGAAHHLRGRGLRATVPPGIPGYELGEEIGRGAQGRVYRARQGRPGRWVALKVIAADEMASPQLVARFRIEAEAAARLHHPHIVPIYEVGELDGWHYFSMRLIEGPTLGRAARERRYSCDGAAELLAKVARAIHHAHGHGILHRDLKPGNILLDDAGEPHVSDFGLARFTERDSELTLTQAALGTPAYMSPEQAEGRTGEVTTATDVYGLGAILYELLAGRPPFLSGSVIETLRLVSRSEPPALPGVPRDLATVCLKCLRRSPGDRYASAEALAEDLERFRRGEPVSARPLPPLGRFSRWAVRQPVQAALLGLTILSVAAGLLGVFWQWRQAERARAEQGEALDRTTRALAAQDRALAHLRWQEIGHWLSEGDAPRSLAFLASMLRADPDHWQAAMYAMSVVDRHAFPMPAGPELRPPGRLAVPARLAWDGRWVAGAGEDRVVRIWETATGRELARIGRGAGITALAVGPEWAPLAVATEEGGVWVASPGWDGGRLLGRSGTAAIQELVFGGGGTWLAGRTEGGVEWWRVREREGSSREVRIEGGVAGLRVSGAGTTLLGWNRTEARAWDAASGAEVVRMTAGKRFLDGAVAARGGRVSLLDGEHLARTWDVVSGRELGVGDSLLGGARGIALDGEGRRLTVGGDTPRLLVWDVDLGRTISPPMRHRYDIVRLHPSPDGSRVVSSGWDAVVNQWNATTGLREVQALVLGHGGMQANADPSWDGSLVLVGMPADAGKPEGLGLTVWTRTRVTEPRRRGVEGMRGFDGCRLSPDGRLGCLGLSPANRTYLYEWETGRVVLDRPTSGSVYVHLFSPDQRRYYALTDTGWLHGWDLGTGEPLWPPDRQPGMIRPGAISPDGAHIVAGHNDGHIRVHDAATGRLTRTLEHPGEIKVLRFAPDGSGRFVSGSTDRLGHVWDVRSGERLATFRGHEGAIISAGWSPDARRVATASYDSTARLWDAATGEAEGEPMRHLAWLSHLEFSPDGRWIGTACRDGTARLWDARTGLPRGAPMPHPSVVDTVRFTADGLCLVVQNHDGFRLWDVASAKPVSVHYDEPIQGGVGMDSESYRAILTPDGTGVFIACAASHGALWKVPQPRGRAPDWLPDLLEGLALIRLGPQDSLGPVSGGLGWRVRERLRGETSRDGYTEWARGVLGLDEATVPGR